MTPDEREDTMADQTEQEQIDPWKALKQSVYYILEPRAWTQFCADVDEARAADAAQVRERDAQIADIKAMREDMADEIERLQAALLRYQTAELEQNAVIARLSAQVEQLQAAYAKHQEMYWPHDGEGRDAHLYEIRNGHNRAFVDAHVEELIAESELVSTLRAERDAAQQTLERCREVQQTTAEAWRIEHEEMAQQIATLTEALIKMQAGADHQRRRNEKLRAKNAQHHKDIARLSAALRVARPYVEAAAKASHFADGFDIGPDGFPCRMATQQQTQEDRDLAALQSTRPQEPV